jgi:hypothetical protein
MGSTAGLVIKPIKSFYNSVTFGEGMLFKSYEFDVRSRHKYEIEACLLYLKDFMRAIDAEDVSAIQELREHRNEMAHELTQLIQFNPIRKLDLLINVDKALFKLSNHNTYMEIGSDPKYKCIDWETAYGPEYALFKLIVENVGSLKFINRGR